MRKFSAQQRRYMVAKSQYEAAIRLSDWEWADRMEDGYLDAESDLVEWMIDEAEKTGKMPKKEIELLRKNWVSEKYRPRIIEMAMSLAI